MTARRTVRMAIRLAPIQQFPGEVLRLDLRGELGHILPPPFAPLQVRAVTEGTGALGKLGFPTIAPPVAKDPLQIESRVFVSVEPERLRPPLPMEVDRGEGDEPLRRPPEEDPSQRLDLAGAPEFILIDPP